MKIFWLFLIIITGCSTHSSLNTASIEWKPMGYSGFIESINNLLGENSVNCGFYDITRNIGEPRSTNRRLADKGLNCAIKADRSGKSYKYGTKRLPVDSYAYEILLKTSDSEYWLIVLDVMLGSDDDTQLWIEKCSNVIFQEKSYKGIDCEHISVKEWDKIL